MPTDNKSPLDARVRPATQPAGLDTGLPSTNALHLARPGYPATLDEELAMIVEQRKQPQTAPPCAPVEHGPDEPTRAHFPHGTETVSDGYLNRLRNPVNYDENPIGSEYRRRNR